MDPHNIVKTFTWGPAEWIAFGMLVLTVFSMLVGGIIAVAKFSHRMGRHDERLSQTEREIKDLKASDRNSDNDRAELAVLRALMERVETSLRDLGGDLNRRMGGIEADIRRYLVRRED